MPTRSRRSARAPASGLRNTTGKNSAIEIDAEPGAGMGQGPGEPTDRDALHPHADQRDGVAAGIDAVVPVGESLDDIAEATGKQAIAEQGQGCQIEFSALRQLRGETAADADRLDRQGQTGSVIGLEQDAAQRRFALGDLRALAGHLGDES